MQLLLSLYYFHVCVNATSSLGNMTIFGIIFFKFAMEERLALLFVLAQKKPNSNYARNSKKIAIRSSKQNRSLPRQPFHLEATNNLLPSCLAARNLYCKCSIKLHNSGRNTKPNTKIASLYFLHFTKFCV